MCEIGEDPDLCYFFLHASSQGLEGSSLRNLKWRKTLTAWLSQAESLQNFFGIV
jgi:hypothetical protein